MNLDIKGVHRIGLEVPNPIIGKFLNPNPIRNDPVRIRSDPNFKNDSDPIRKNPKAISEGIKHV